jgi:hypothetical protein
VVHGDLVCPISPATNGGCQYFLTLVDQHTGFIHIALLREKSDTTAKIVKYKTLYEKQTGNSIKKLITNGGGEFCNKVLSGILERDGIQHNVAPPYTPQHNGLAEQANRTVIKMTRCMMLQSNLAPEWWGEASKTASATTNALPSLSKSKSSPSQLFLKISLRPDFFKPFGCKAWAFKPKVKRDNKFDAISWEGTLVGYENDYLSYQIFKHNDKQFELTREVQFDERSFPQLAAINKSHLVRAWSVANVPVFVSDPVLLFDDSPELDEEVIANDADPDEEVPMEDFPSNPENGR